MANRIDIQRTLQIHSQAKVEFYKTYLERYLRILCLSDYIKNINIYDVFCGMGIYDDGGKGSPIVAYEAIREFANNPKLRIGDTKTTLIVNDLKKERVENVKTYIETNHHSFCNVKYHNLDIDEMFKVVLKEVNDSASITRNLIFIDPYGYKNIRKELLFELMKNGKTEIILFLPISHMYRFTNTAIQDEETIQYEPLKRFVNSFFPNPSHPIRQSNFNVMEYIDYIADALSFNNQYYSTSYYIERDNANRFALFFITKHIFGFEKILEVKWELDEENGRGFRIPDYNLSLFAEEFAEDAKNTNAQKLESILIDYLKQPKTNCDIYEITLTKGFLPKHTNEILKKLQKNNPKFNAIDLSTNEDARKGSFYISYKYYNNPPKVLICIKP